VERTLLEDLEDRYAHLDEQLDALETERKRLKRDREYADKRMEQLRELQQRYRSLYQDLREEKKGLDEERRLLDKERDELRQRREELREAEQNLGEKRAEVAAERHRAHQEALEEFKDERSAVRERLNDIQEELNEETAKLEEVRNQIAKEKSWWQKKKREDFSEIRQKLETRREELDEKELNFDEREAELEAREKSLEKRQKRLSSRRERLDDLIEERAEEFAHSKVEQLQREKSLLKEDQQAITERLEEARKKVDNFRNRLQELGGQEISDLQDKIERLEEENDDLRRRLDSRPTESDRERLQNLESQREAWERKRRQLRRENEDLKNRISNKEVAASELERLRNEREALQAHVNALEKRLNDIQADVDEITGGHGPFPKLSSLDQEDSTRPRDLETEIPLGDLIEYAQTQMAGRDTPLYYPLKILRLFVSGLAASRLIILEGVSGTGKSSLPEAFADAIGGGYGSVSVQSDWKDRHDLLGHYNSFENRFHETDFLEHLYRAQLPEYEDRPYFIVLDEMNLSRPEYYFADFLSKLEDRRRRGRDADVTVPLLSHPLENTDKLPAALQDQRGEAIRIPRNVWFVGTANQDETTLRFAPKTYDRAHVIEIPRSRADVDDLGLSPMDPPLGWMGLRQSFDSAEEHNREAAESVVGLFEDLSDYLYDAFGLSWGNRLEQQARRFVTSYMAADGSASHAADHLLATKVLRKIKGRFDLRKDDLEDLELKIQGRLAGLDETSNIGDVDSLSSIKLIREEKRRLS
jgi:peptidoglycan hydrolase CwlO-like protein